MKKIITTALVLGLITSCVKTKENLDPQKKPYIDGQLFSYSNNVPIAGAAVGSSKCTQPDFSMGGCLGWDDKTVVTSADGGFSIQRGYESYLSIYKAGYWDYGIWSGSSYGRPGEIQFLNNSAGLEKVIIKLFEKVKVNVHLKNTSPIAHSLDLAFFAEGVHQNKFSAYPVLLRKGIDTTFEYVAFGDISNRMKVVRGSASYYLGGFSVDSVLYSKDILLTSGSIGYIDINF